MHIALDDCLVLRQKPVIFLGQPLSKEPAMKFEDIYEVKEFIGKGSFAEVKKCINQRTREIFAVKEISFGAEEDQRKAENEVEVSITFVSFQSPRDHKPSLTLALLFPINYNSILPTVASHAMRRN